MREDYINKIVNLLRHERLTVVIAIYNSLSSILDKKW